MADRLEETRDELLAINALEVAAYGESGPGRDRLTLDARRAWPRWPSALREIAAAPDPLFEVVDASDATERPARRAASRAARRDRRRLREPPQRDERRGRAVRAQR